jgi:YfiH family protein
MTRLEPLTLGELCGSPWLYHSTTLLAGVRHGFLGRPLDFSKQRRAESSRELCAALGAKGLALVKQVHGNDVTDLSAELQSEPACEADAILFPLITPEAPVIVGVRTSDCVPIILTGRSFGAVIHAGWRGLAAGVISSAILALRDRGEKTLRALIGPSAGAKRYEVGMEVPSAIGSTAVWTDKGDGKALLDLGASAEAQLLSLDTPVLARASICTIEDVRFHSYRRDGEKMGSNLTFVVTRLADQW